MSKIIIKFTTFHYEVDFDNMTFVRLNGDDYRRSWEMKDEDGALYAKRLTDDGTEGNWGIISPRFQYAYDSYLAEKELLK